VPAPFNPTAATAQIAGLLMSYGLHQTVGDKYAQQWPVDAFRKCRSDTSIRSASGARSTLRSCRCS
jgi:hypothetical protein